MKNIINLLFVLIGIQIHAQNITLLWDKNTDPYISGYKLYLGAAPNKYYRIYNIQDSNTTNITIQFKQLIRGATNYFALSAYNKYNLESEKSDEARIYIYNKPFFAPVSLQYKLLETNKILLSWDNIEPKNPVTEYLVEYKNSFFENWKNLLTTNTNSVIIKPLKSINYYRVSSGNDLGYGKPSDEISVTLTNN